MTRIRLDLGGPSGNAFVILGYATSLGRQFGMSEEEVTDLHNRMTGRAFAALGKGTDYEHLVRTFHEAFPIVELYADRDIGLPEDLCEIITNKEIYEL